MQHYILQINNFDIEPGKLEAFKASVRHAQAFARANDPLLAADMYIDEQNLRARACLIHRDPSAILAHWTASQKHMTNVMDHCTARSVEILGDPGEAVMERLRQYEDAGVALRMTPHFAGFNRLAPERHSGAGGRAPRWSGAVRRVHRALAVIFAALVVVNIVLNFIPVSEQVTLTVGLLTLLPLFLLLLSGLYLFALPYVMRRWSRRPAVKDAPDAR